MFSGYVFGRMYLLYSVLSVVALVIASPFLAYQAVRHRKYVRSLRQRLGYLPLSFNIDGDESIWIHAVSVGETLTARALIGELKTALPGLEAVPLDHDDDRPRGGPGADRRRRRLLLPARLGLHRPPHPRRRPAAPVRHDGDRDLADPAARVPRARRGHDARQRPHLEALVRPLSPRAPLLPPRPRRRRSVLHAERGGGAADRRARRRSAPASSSPAA